MTSTRNRLEEARRRRTAQVADINLGAVPLQQNPMEKSDVEPLHQIPMEKSDVAPLQQNLMEKSDVAVRQGSPAQPRPALSVRRKAKPHRLQIELPEELFRRVAARAESEEISIAELTRQLYETFLNPPV